MKSTYCSVYQTEANTTEENSEEPVEDEEDREGSKESIPEPEDKVDLLIDDVLEEDNSRTSLYPKTLYLGEDTQPVVNLRPSSSSNIGNVAGGHRGEHRAHGVPRALVSLWMLSSSQQLT